MELKPTKHIVVNHNFTNSMYHSCSKHIEVRYHWLRLVVEQQSFKLALQQNVFSVTKKFVTKSPVFSSLRTFSDEIGLFSDETHFVTVTSSLKVLVTKNFVTKNPI